MWDFLDRFDWLTALDRADIEEAWKAHGPPLKTNEGDWWYAYASDADARTGVLAILEDVAVILQRHGERDPREVMDAARHIHDKVIMTVDRSRPRDTWIDRGGFTAALAAAQTKQKQWSAIVSTRGPAAPSSHRSARVATLEQRQWAAAQIKAAKTTPSELQRKHGGPSETTIQNTLLDGAHAARQKTWEDFVQALNECNHRNGRKITLTLDDIPGFCPTP